MRELTDTCNVYVRAVQEAEDLVNKRDAREDGALRSLAQKEGIARSLPDDEATIVK